jgi:hypothetical protein
MRLSFAGLALMVLAPTIGAAQTGTNWLEVPDAAAAGVASGHRFYAMPPGFHITTDASGLLALPGDRADGRYRLEAELYLFPGNGAGGYGLFAGGSGIEQGDPSYIAFVLRRNGDASVYRHDGSDSTVYLPWARPDSVLPQAGEDPVANTLAIQARSDSVVFVVNGRRFGAIDRRRMPVDGQFGYRVGPALSVHATTLDVTTHLAPGR